MLSFEELQNKLCALLQKNTPSWWVPSDGPWLIATFPEFVIIQSGGKLWQLPYTVTATQDIEVGEPVQVTVDYKIVGQALALDARSLPTTEAPGARWHVQILKFGRSKNGWIWTPEIGKQLVPMLDRCPLGLYNYGGGRGMNHLRAEDLVEAGGALVRHIVGHIEHARIDGDAIVGEAVIHDDQQWLRDRLLTLERNGVLRKALGLSIDTHVGFSKVRAAEGESLLVTAVKQLFGTDIVTAPAAEGRFMRAVAGLLNLQQEDVMTKTELLALIRERRPDLLAGRAVEALTDAEVTALAREAMAPAPTTPPAAEPEWAKKLREDMELRDSQARAAEAIEGAKLPVPVADKLKGQFAGRIVKIEDVNAAIETERKTLARLSESGEVRGFGHASPRIELGAESVDKVQVAMDRMFGISDVALTRAAEAFTPYTKARVLQGFARAAEAHKSAGAELRFMSLKQAYIAITGDSDVSGRAEPRAGRAAEAENSGSFANILGNTLYRRMLADYAMVDYGERSIITVGRAEDFRTKDAVRMKYFGDIDDVNPENADYAEMPPIGGDEKVQYAVGQKGNLLTITRQMIINDDLRAVQTLVSRLGRAGRRTFARFVWNFWITNAVYDVDGLAWFHATHANLQSVALANAEIVGAILKLQNMTEPGSGEKLGLGFPRGFDNMGLWLVVPTALWDTARKENEREYTDANFTPNAIRYAFGRSSERVIVNPLLTDVTDWGIFRDPSDVASIHIDFLMGQEEPVLFLADNPLVGQMFVGDKLQYKYRHEFGGDVVDFRGAVKAVVA